MEEPREVTKQRRTVALLYFFAALLIGLPWWSYSTTVHRAPLPYDEMNKYASSINDLLEVNLDIYVTYDGSFTDLVEATQLCLDEKFLREVPGWKITLHDGPAPSADDYHLNVAVGGGDAYFIDEKSREIFVWYSMDFVAKDLVPEMVAVTLIEYVFGGEIKTFKNRNEEIASMAYSPTYHITFSLFDGAFGSTWDIAEALDQYFSPLLEHFSEVANVTTDTQVQYYASPACHLNEMEVTMSNGDSKEKIQAHVIHSGDLSTFVNHAEWSLTSIHAYPTINFILYVPDYESEPLLIEGSSTNSFTVPQWGGVKVLERRVEGNHLSVSDLEPVLEIFASQLLSLFDVPAIPKSPVIRLDMLARRNAVRALLNAASTLGSLERLSKSLPNIAIPDAVLTAVNETIDGIEQSLEFLEEGDWRSAVKTAGIAQKNSETAFFEKMMVQQAFFPEEHQLAVFMPLLGPCVLVILIGMARIFKDFKRVKGEQSEEKKKDREIDSGKMRGGQKEKVS